MRASTSLTHARRTSLPAAVTHESSPAAGSQFRPAPGKSSARLVDYVVVPDANGPYGQELARREMTRVVEFGESSINPEVPRERVWKVLDHFGLLHLIGGVSDVGVQELLLDYVKDLPPQVKRVLIETLVAEQALLDLDRPRGVKDQIQGSHRPGGQDTGGGSVDSRRLQLKDFRQYRGEHDLEFAFDTQRNVTLVTGVNGAGKTGLFYALNWVLYGDAEALPGSLISKAAVIEDEHPVAWVQLHFIHGGKEFVARRELVRTPAGKEREESFTLQILDAGGRVQNSKDPEAVINVVLPRDARRYFFFDGERIDELSRPGHEKEVRDAVRSVLQLKVLERAGEHLTDIARQYSKSLKEQGELDAEQMRQIERVEFFTNAVAQGESRLTDVRERVELLRRQLEQTRAKLDQLVEVRVLQSQEREVETRRSGSKSSSPSLRSLSRRSSTRRPASLALGAVRRAETVLESKRERGEMPVRHPSAVHRGSDLGWNVHCGRPLEHESISALERRHKGAESSELVDAVLRILGELKALEARTESSQGSPSGDPCQKAGCLVTTYSTFSGNWRRSRPSDRPTFQRTWHSLKRHEESSMLAIATRSWSRGG